MKKIKDLHKYLIGIAIGIIIVGSVSVYAVEAVIQSKEVSYDNKESHGRSEDVQGSIDELYERSGILKEKWKDPILHGADPVIDDGGELIPVEIDGTGTVKYANLYTKWYEYETKRWANAVILVDSQKGKYKTGDKIPEEAIESYFVWIPRYKYKIWDLGKYNEVYNFSDLQDSTDITGTDNDLAARRIMASTRLIDVVFQNKSEKTSDSSGECASSTTSGGGSNCDVGEYMTHPAFTLGQKELNGIWVGKFEVTGDISNITVKPGLESLKNQTVKSFWNALYGYRKGSSDHNLNLDPHMMKNTEWGAVAYLSHSIYGIGNEININNNSEYKTGYSAAANTDQSSYPGTSGKTKDATQPWNTSTGYLASTTGNITGIYDMSGGAWEYMAAYMDGKPGASGLSSELNDANYTKYFDKYSASSTIISFDQRILGDATGEMGPFYLYFDKDGAVQRHHNAWYADASYFVNSTSSWFRRGGSYIDGVLVGHFAFDCRPGGVNDEIGSRLVLVI